VTLLNFSMTPTNSMEEFVNTILEVARLRRQPMSLPRSLLIALSYPISAAARTLAITQPVSPTRVRKLYRSTNIEAERLQTLGYRYRYSLKEALEDWKKDVPADF
jgi:hypothetical protein